MRVTLLIFYIIFTLPGRASAGTLDLTGSWSTGVEAMVLYVLEDHTFIIRDADGQLQQGGWGLHDEDQYDVQLVSFTYGRASDTYRAQSDGQTIRFEDDGIDGHKIWVRYHDDALLVLNRALQEEFERSGLSAQRISTLIKAYVQA
ncbi:MAG: hypothetical protein OER96_14040, partial [Gammaproteobacteria bacterium]|nr:hypothetical protein [Gammaproteobacteria bacterium]